MRAILFYSENGCGLKRSRPCSWLTSDESVSGVQGYTLIKRLVRFVIMKFPLVCTHEPPNSTKSNKRPSFFLLHFQCHKRHKKEYEQSYKYWLGWQSVRAQALTLTVQLVTENCSVTNIFYFLKQIYLFVANRELKEIEQVEKKKTHTHF